MAYSDLIKKRGALALTGALLFGCGEKMPPEPALGGVEITAADGTPIPQDKLVVQDVKAFLERLLLGAKDKGNALLQNENITQFNNGVIIDNESGSYFHNIDKAIAQIIKGDYEGARANVKDALAFRPEVRDDVIQDANTRQLEVIIKTEIIPPLEAAATVLGYLEKYRSLTPPPSTGNAR